MPVNQQDDDYQVDETYQSMNMFKLEQNNTSIIFYVWNTSSGVLQLSPMFEKVFGMNPKSFADFKTCVFEDDTENLERAVSGTTGPDNVTVFMRLKTKNIGYVRFVACFNSVGEDIIAGTLIPSNINHKRQGDVIDILHERRKFALEAAEAGLWDWDATTNDVFYDSKYLAMLGYPSCEFAQEVDSWAERVHPEDYDKTVARQYQHIASPEHGDFFTCKYRFRAASGNYLWIRGQGKVLSRDEDGRALRLVGLHVDITEEEEAKAQLEFMANHDVLTGLHNRAYFERLFASNAKELLPAAYIVADADGLKMINDCVNHAAGDLMLQRLAHTLRCSVRSSDMLARIGGDEFAILLPNTEKKNAIKIIEKIAQSLDDNNKAEKSIAVCASLGLACAETEEDLCTLYVRADEAMMEQKKKQRPESFKKITVWIESFTGRSIQNYHDNRTGAATCNKRSNDKPSVDASSTG